VRRSEDAIAAEEADRAFDGLRSFDALVLAVSGGPDSLALLYLVAEWVARRGAIVDDVSVVTVDHGLRAQSPAEARFVATHAAALGLAHTIVPWEGPKPSTGIPNAAREARYTLLKAHVLGFAERRRVAIVTAHHQDDQAETVFMRLARGGGVEALAAMAHSRLLGSEPHRRLELVRPLLAFPKQRLIATLAQRGAPWIDDPTNSDEALERTRVRAALVASGLAAPALAMTARRMREAAEGLAFAQKAFETALQLTIDRGITARFERRTFDTAPVILRQNVLSRLIGIFGGATAPPALSEVEALAARFGRGEQWAATLGGVMISAGARFVRLWREPGRISADPVRMTSGVALRWDERLDVGFEGGVDTAINVAPLGRAAFEAMADDVSGDLPAGAVHGLPAFFSGSTLLAVPLLGITTAKSEEFKALRFWCNSIHDESAEP
jgi:tRNA(Ile)-lysidine synthase